MSRPIRRLLGQFPFSLPISSIPTRSISRWAYSQSFSNTTQQRANDEDGKEKSPDYTLGSIFQMSNTQPVSTPSTDPSNQSTPQTPRLKALAEIIWKNESERAQSSPDQFIDISRVDSIGGSSSSGDGRFEEPHHFHVYATKHNTHITLTRPSRDPIISVSTGNIGFRKSGRKHYDSAFQLAGFVLGKMQDQGINAQIKRLEVTLRGFGYGREAVTKALLGIEGKRIRHKVVKVSDATRLKFGGTRSKKPRRLG